MRVKMRAYFWRYLFNTHEKSSRNVLKKTSQGGAKLPSAVRCRSRSTTRRATATRTSSTTSARRTSRRGSTSGLTAHSCRARKSSSTASSCSWSMQARSRRPGTRPSRKSPTSITERERGKKSSEKKTLFSQ